MIAILSIINITLQTIDINGLTFTVTAVTLPLSGLWASTTLEPAGNGGGQAVHQLHRGNVFEAPQKSDSCDLNGTTKTADSETELLDLGSFLSSDSGKEKGYEV